MNKFLLFKYMTLGVIVLYVLFIVYFKLRYPFWSKQPIFYYHDLGNLLFPRGVIETSLPALSNKINKLVVYKNASLLSKKEIENLNTLLANNYMTESQERYTPTNNDVMDHLICKNMPSNVSLYYDNLYGDLIGAMTSSYKTFITSSKNLQVGYVDNLCVDKKHRGKNIAGQLIQNHYIRERYQHKTAVYMFKHEGISRPFVPLTIYNTYFYRLDKFDKILITQNYLSSVLITDDNSHLLYDLQTTLTKQVGGKGEQNNTFLFKCVIMDEFKHLTYLMKKQHLFVFCLVEEGEPLAFYFFKNNYTTYNDDKSIECFSCIKYNPHLENNKFLLGFYLAIDRLKSMDKYKILLLENISDSHHLLQNIKQSPYHSSKFYYYMYNYAMKPVSAKHIVIL